jgi:hypothetical protein
MLVRTEISPAGPRIRAIPYRRADSQIPCERGTVHIPDGASGGEVSLAVYQVDNTYICHAQEVKSDGRADP